MRFYVHRTNTVNTRYEENELFDTEIDMLIDVHQRLLMTRMFNQNHNLVIQKITTLKEEQQMRANLLKKINFKNIQKREIGHVIKLTEKEIEYSRIIEIEQDYYSRNNTSTAIIQ